MFDILDSGDLCRAHPSSPCRHRSLLLCTKYPVPIWGSCIFPSPGLHGSGSHSANGRYSGYLKGIRKADAVFFPPTAQCIVGGTLSIKIVLWHHSFWCRSFLLAHRYFWSWEGLQGNHRALTGTFFFFSWVCSLSTSKSIFIVCCCVTIFHTFSNFTQHRFIIP